MLIAGVGAAAYVLKFRPSDHHPAPQPTTMVSSQSVGVVAESAVPATSGRSGLSLVQMVELTGVPAFAPLSLAAANSEPSPRWTAALMAGGGYIFIYLQNGDCLAAGSRARLVMRHCDYGATQRWRRVGGALDQDGHDFYQYANVAAGKCLSQTSTLAGAQDPASLATCKPARPPSEMFALWASTQ